MVQELDLNNASEHELAQYEDLGAERAAMLVKTRPFHDWDDIARLPGFDEALVHRLMRRGARIS